MRIGHYLLQIHYPQDLDLHPLITDILGVVPTHTVEGQWELYIHEGDDEWVDFINYFLNILEGKYDSLMKIGIPRENITLFAVYEYGGQCNTEFEPETLLRLGTNGIALAISCWENLDLEHT